MQQAWLFPMIRAELSRLLNSYVRAPELMEDLDNYVIPPGLGMRSGILGAIALADDAFRSTQLRGTSATTENWKLGIDLPPPS
jgi:fructokinase